MNERILTIDLNSEDELAQASQMILEALGKHKKNNLCKLYTTACVTGDPDLIVLGAAMMVAHHTPIEEIILDIPDKPTASELAHHIVQRQLVVNKLSDVYHEKIRQKLIQNFDVMGFVFDHTDYDECDNGHFYRRS